MTSSDSLLDNFFKRFKSAPHRLLMLDYDGTLAPFRVKRNQALPYPGVKEALSEIGEAGGEIVVISGRRAHDVSALLQIEPRPLIWGCHGFERLSTDGKLLSYPLPEEWEEVTGKVKEMLHVAGLDEHIEVKYGSLAIHWRGETEDRARSIRSVAEKAMESVATKSIALSEYDGGLELRSKGRDKGIVVREALQGHASDTAAAFLGDDMTDEDGFRAIKGAGLGVLVRPEFRETAAEVWIRPPEELLKFLVRWAKACRKAS